MSRVTKVGMVREAGEHLQQVRVEEEDSLVPQQQPSEVKLFFLLFFLSFLKNILFKFNLPTYSITSSAHLIMCPPQCLRTLSYPSFVLRYLEKCNSCLAYIIGHFETVQLYGCPWPGKGLGKFRIHRCLLLSAFHSFSLAFLFQ